MTIFLRRIPAYTKHDEIADFIYPALKKGLFRKTSNIINVEILALKDIQRSTIEFHGLVTLDCEIAGQKAVYELKDRRLNGRLVVVRSFCQRNWNNDPRQQNNSIDGLFLEKRKGDRRRGGNLQVINNAADHFNNPADFFRTIHKQ